MYTFDVKRKDKLPKLAWLCEVDSGLQKVSIYCGDKVEITEDFFVAGTWDGEFLEAGFDVSDAFYGTGCKLQKDGVLFSTPSHALERLQYYDMDGRFVMSNSLSMLMAYCNLELDKSEDQYEAYFCSVLDGFGKFKSKIPMADGKHIHISIVSNIFVDDDGKVTISRRKKMDPFTSYNDYYTRLKSSLSLVKANATSKDRKNSSFGVVSTCSSGYDSSACCSLARGLGADTAVSLAGGSYEVDDGSDIAKKLGFTKVIRKDKNLYIQNDDMIDAEYVSSGELGTMLQFSVFSEIFANNLVFFGSRGSYWEKELDMTEDFEMDNYYFYETNVSWTEDSLRYGYICVPVPAFGASVCTSIREITNSFEMKPWTLNRAYDKPIPRRIVEEAGVPREMFGQKKYGGGFYLGFETTKSLKNKLSKQAYKNFIEFKKSFRYKKWTKHFASGVRYFKNTFPIYFGYVCNKSHIKCKLKCKAPRVANPFAPSILFHWSVDVMKKKYTNQLGI